ncbi:thioether cross-link-forming SCIFF peptide maturase [Dehalobacter sp. DCM]|uniref:thioether cross-link-forming SCIFF peptide maturase n=1 Tax=Dehalobacter sp. DCM TaxID=2907827 RepID=UPI003081EA8B|nr:thioether cross-link-forming SCIFF peptide maturase [Dehalobacter sp. DCM]
MELINYCIEKNVHVYRQGDINVAYDVNSGSLHVLDDVTQGLILEMVAWQRKNGLKEFAQIVPNIGLNLIAEEKHEILTELSALQKQGLLFSPEAEETVLLYPDEPIIKAMCLHVAHDCNLRCGYCFAGTGPFGGSRQLMSLETGKKALNFLLDHSGERQQCEVDFFGGEPLMNFPVVKELIAYGKEIAAQAGKKMKFTLTTNAVLLDQPTADFLEKEEISVVLSIDGRKDVNDRMRPFLNGAGSYDRIMPQILSFARRRPNSSPYATGNYYYVRGTYTHFNTDFYKDVLHLADSGINRISVEPVVASPQEEYAFRDEDLTEIKRSYDILGEKVLEYRRDGKEFVFFHFNAGLDEGPCLVKRLSGCGAGHEYVAISPEGDIYPCHQFVGQEQYKLGSLDDSEGFLDPKIVQAFRRAQVYSKEECRSCWARFSCSGGCHAANTAFSGELTKVYPLGCELQKKRLEIAYYLKIKEASQRNLLS